ncbi:hypothetical protein, partial [Virgibacillus sp. DJP39]|uniref:hypothetical protein n=1 Tax=Virgibacillus sp. DJP39 TaxID=3409790 RepID=UPI003BB5B397
MSNVVMLSVLIPVTVSKANLVSEGVLNSLPSEFRNRGSSSPNKYRNVFVKGSEFITSPRLFECRILICTEGVLMNIIPANMVSTQP